MEYTKEQIKVIAEEPYRIIALLTVKDTFKKMLTDKKFFLKDFCVWLEENMFFKDSSDIEDMLKGYYKELENRRYA